MEANMPIGSDFRSLLIVAMLATTSLFVVTGCRLGSSAEGAHDSAAAAGSLTDTRLVDQNGKTVSLAAFKGKPLVVDFIYTSCPGTCLMETAKLTNVAVGLGTDLGWKASIVSITVDPEHDSPARLREYAQQQGADKKGWYFLTGSAADVDRALAGFKMFREKGPDGSVGHLVDMLLLGPDGREVRDYDGQIVKPKEIVEDVRKALNEGWNMPHEVQVEPNGDHLRQQEVMVNHGRGRLAF
jgi:protein SCO1/2